MRKLTAMVRRRCGGFDRSSAAHDDLPRFLSIFESIAQTMDYALVSGGDPSGFEAIEHHGGQLRRGASHGLGPGEGFAPARSARRRAGGADGRGRGARPAIRTARSEAGTD